MDFHTTAFEAIGVTNTVTVSDRAAQGVAARLVRPGGAVLTVGDWPLPLEAALAGSPS